MLIRHSFKLCQESIFHYNLDLQDLALYSQALSGLVVLPEMDKSNACQPQAISQTLQPLWHGQTIVGHSAQLHVHAEGNCHRLHPSNI